MKNRYRDLILIGCVLLFALLLALFLRGQNKETGPVLQVYVTVDGEEILRAPLMQDAVYQIMDGKATEVAPDITLSSLGDEAKPSLHDVNLVVIKDGVVQCSESNCENQVCVHTAPISGESHDLPIVCLPHGLFLYVTEE